LRVGVIGVGHLGCQHARILKELPGVELVGLHDRLSERARKPASELGAAVFDRAEELLDAVDAVSVAVPATQHLGVARLCFERGKHVFLEKPLASSMPEADAIVRESTAKGLVLQVGHVERFNPAVKLAESLITSPRFVEGHRLGPFAGRGTDVDVVLDLMIHDIDLILHFVKSPVKAVDAVGVPVLSHAEDIANARMECENGCIANLTSSRVSQKQVRKLRFFQPDSYVSIDCMKREVDLVRKTAGRVEDFPEKPVEVTEIAGERGAHIQKSKYQCKEGDPLREELAEFVDCVRAHRKPVVGGGEARESLRVALLIAEAIRERYARDGSRRDSLENHGSPQTL